MKNYQDAYRRLFDRIIGGEAFSSEANAVRQELDRMPGSDEQKTSWGLAVGVTIYMKHAYDV